MSTSSEPPPASPPRSFEALRHPGFRAFVVTFMLTMMADNIEHVISYWMMEQKFHSPTLAGFAVVAHWLPYLIFSVPVGSLNDRLDSRRLIQAGGALFALVSLGWGYFFLTDSLKEWHAMVLLVLHGCAGVLWMTSSQILLYDVVGPQLLPSAVRINATARYLGVLIGPGIGSVSMHFLGPTVGMFVNAAGYLPLLLWLIAAPYGRAHRGEKAPAQRAVRGLSDILGALDDVRKTPVLLPMMLLTGFASMLIGNSYQAQMPSFARDLGNADPGAAYSALLAADAAGALLAGVLLETGRRMSKVSATGALQMAILWGVSLGGFALSHSYPLALLCLFVAGFSELSFSSINQTVVQMNAPLTTRGRVLGLFTMSSAGLRTFSGVVAGALGRAFNVHVALCVASVVFVVLALGLLARARRAEASLPPAS